MTKETVASALKEMPEEFNLDELFARLVFMEQLEEGLRQLKNGEPVAHADMKKEIEEWLLKQL